MCVCVCVTLSGQRWALSHAVSPLIPVTFCSSILPPIDPYNSFVHPPPFPCFPPPPPHLVHIREYIVPWGIRKFSPRVCNSNVIRIILWGEFFALICVTQWKRALVGVFLDITIGHRSLQNKIWITFIICFAWAALYIRIPCSLQPIPFWLKKVYF